MKSSFESAVALRDEIVMIRRDLHRHPETAFEEVRTARLVAEQLSEMGMEVQTGVGKTGVIGILEGVSDGPTVLVRADMDALPMDEETGAEYASTVPGKMHACGHDGHVSMALGAARILSEQRDRLHGRVKFVFQPAEEVGSGAKTMVKDGALREPAPDVVFGLHLWNTLPVGEIGLTPGPIMAGASDFVVSLTGKGGHAALPEESIDPVVCAAQIVMALQTIVSRNVSPQDTAVVSVTQVHAGTANNIIPQTAKLTGTFRTFTLETREQVESRMRAIISNIAAAMQCEVDINIQHHTDPVINDEKVVARLKELYGQLDGLSLKLVEDRTMGAEDVGEFMRDAPGAFIFVGSKNDERELNYGHHHPRFDFDEDALPIGTALLVTAVSDYVLKDSDAS